MGGRQLSVALFQVVGEGNSKNVRGYLMDTMTPVCQAKSKQSGKQCGNFAVRDRKVCHIHGGKTPKHNQGAKTKEGKLRQKMASWKHGKRSKEAREESRFVREMIKESKQLIDGL